MTHLIKAQQDALSQVVQAGVRRCAECLSRMCRSDWAIEKIAVGSDSGPEFETLLADVSRDHLGSYLSLPSGSGFLLVFDPKSSLYVSNRFIGDFSDKASWLDKLELQAVNEVSNILINLLVDTLASACPQPLILGAPIPLIDSQRDLLINTIKKFKNLDRLALSCYSRLRNASLGVNCTLMMFLDEQLTADLLKSIN